MVGTLAIASDWSCGILLLVYFFSSSLLTRIGAAAKAKRGGGIVEKSGARDSAQVLANGAVFAAAAVVYLFDRSPLWLAAGAGALAASAADTWGTELGMLAGRPPRMITNWRPVPAGTSGGVSAPGAVAATAGAGLVAATAWLLHWGIEVAFAAAVGGIIGALADSLLGALWQSRRRCSRCGIDTERREHCSTPTERAGGLAWLDNDGVNAACTMIGALVSARLFQLSR